jgi:hypothetical protein
MITADARSRITPNDLDLLSQALGGGATEADRRLIEIGLDGVLDRPELARFLLRGTIPGPSASLFFYVLVRRALLEADLDDRVLADYCAALLREFGLRHRSHQVDEVDDHAHQYLVDILNDLEHCTGDRHFKVLVHLGNYSLWLSGIFPDRIEARRCRRGGPSLGYYETLGQRGFAEASEHRLAEWTGLDGVLQTTAEHFPMVRKALNRVRSELKLAA